MRVRPRTTPATRVCAATPSISMRRTAAASPWHRATAMRCRPWREPDGAPRPMSAPPGPSPRGPAPAAASPRPARSGARHPRRPAAADRHGATRPSSPQPAPPRHEPGHFRGAARQFRQPRERRTAGARYDSEGIRARSSRPSPATGASCTACASGRRAIAPRQRRWPRSCGAWASRAASCRFRDAAARRGDSAA